MKKMESLNSSLFERLKPNQIDNMSLVLGGTTTCYGSSTLDHYGDSGCSDIEYSAASNSVDQNWTRANLSSAPPAVK